jgi:uncharacterized membrane protein
MTKKPSSATGRHRLSNDPHDRKGISDVTGQEYPLDELMTLDSLRPSLASRIRTDHPGMGKDSLVARDEVARYRARYVTELLEAEHGELGTLDREVADSLAANAIVAANTHEDADSERTFGERLSDIMAQFGGSWAFLISFAMLMAIWIGANALLGERGAFDPFPFILLNLVLSCLAAIQAPIIMMSQRRQETKDRLRSRNDYQVNLKAELEIRHLNEKMDHLLVKQWQRLAEIQQLQIELLEELQAARR